MIKTQSDWALPDGIEDILPPYAGHLDNLCRDILAMYSTWGYQLVIPPIIEYADSLLAGIGRDMDLQTFKLIDQLSGRLMGVRADITPQVARIDAHNLQRKTPTRLCYLGTVLHTRPEVGGEGRSFLQVGAELYSHQGIESDAEILALMIETINKAGIDDIYVDIGHAGVYSNIVRAFGLEQRLEDDLFDVLQQKSFPTLADMVANGVLPDNAGVLIETLMEANGPAAEFSRAAGLLTDIAPAVKPYLDELQLMLSLVGRYLPKATFGFDLAELGGYRYHTGIIFTAYMMDRGKQIACGGRYDGIGSAFGYARPATGFSADINTLVGLQDHEIKEPQGIYAPYVKGADRAGQMEVVSELRQRGEIVICELPGQDDTAAAMGCDRLLAFQDGKWVVVPG